MGTAHCELCERPVEARREIGVGTIILSVVTGGMWLFAIPFYDKRCPICKTSAVTEHGGARPPSGQPTVQTRLAVLEQRLGLTEAELEAATAELDRLRSERDFYRQLLGDPSRRAGEGEQP